MRFLRKIYLVDVFFSLKGNPKACIWLEPLWGIPYNLYMPYVSLFMAGLNMTAYDIGIVSSVYYVSQAISSVLSGVLTDKLGRRKATVIFDTLSWSVPSLLWMCSQNIYWFLLAAGFNGLWRITDNSWGLLLVEDADRDKIVPMYSLTSIMGLVAAFVSPLSALAVKMFNVVPTMRFLYGFTCVSMTAKFVILYFCSKETSVGVRRIAATRNKSIFKSLWECKDVFLHIIREKRMVLTVGILASFSLVSALNGNYFALYLNKRLGIPESNMAVYSMVMSFVRLACMFIFARHIKTDSIKRPLITAWLMFIAGQVLLLINPGGAFAIPLTFVEVILEAAALSVLYPMTSSLLFINADIEERARINGLVFATIALVTSAFPAIVGYFANTNLRIPFFVNIGVYALAILMTIEISKMPPKAEDKQQ